MQILHKKVCATIDTNWGNPANVALPPANLLAQQIFNPSEDVHASSRLPIFWKAFSEYNLQNNRDFRGRLNCSAKTDMPTIPPVSVVALPTLESLV